MSKNEAQSPHSLAITEHKIDMVTGEPFAENNEIAQAMAIPRSIPRFPDVEDLNANRAIPPRLDNDALLDLPDDVKKNMIGYDDMELEHLLIKVFGQYSHPIDVDRMVMTLWLSHQKKYDRMKVIRMLRTMAKNGTVVKKEGTKGTYDLTDAGSKCAFATTTKLPQ